jgi:hypothetical protein
MQPTIHFQIITHKNAHLDGRCEKREKRELKKLNIFYKHVIIESLEKMFQKMSILLQTTSNSFM